MSASEPRVKFGASEIKNKYDAIVLGAGITGLVSASVLLHQGCKNVLVVDEYDHIGGNHIDRSCNGFTFDIGSFIFQDDSPLLAHFPELLPLYEPVEPAWVRLTPQGKVTDYPISVRDDILAAGPIDLPRIFISVLYARLFQRKMRNAKEFARFWIGQFLLDRSGLESYMQRFYGVAADQIDIDLARKRMQWISEHASVRNVLHRLFGPKHSGPTNKQLARPREGFGKLYAVAESTLQQRGAHIRLGVGLSAIQRVDDVFGIMINGVRVETKRLISTVPIDRTLELCGFDVETSLETITLISLFFSFSGDRGFKQPIIYNFSHEGSWKRITVYSDFYGPVHERAYFTAEVIANGSDASVAEAEASFRKHVRANGLFKGDLTLEGSHTLTNAYPIYRQGAAQRAAEAIARLRDLGVESFGRQGGFNYQPTARASTVEAEAELGHQSAH